MTDLTIDSSIFYQTIGKDIKELVESVASLKESFGRLEEKLENLNHNTKNKIEGIRMTVDSIDKSVRDFERDTKNKFDQIDSRLKPLEEDWMVKQRIGKYANSSIGTKIIGVLVLAVMSLGGFELYRAKSPDQKKYIEALEKQNHLLQQEIKIIKER